MYMKDYKIANLKVLHSMGLGDRAIARELEVNHRTVQKWLKELGLSTNGKVKTPLRRLGDGTAICSKCCEIKPESEFQTQRTGKDHPYKLSYCVECRRKQIRDNLNSQLEKFLADKYSRLLARCKKDGIECSITKDEFIEIYHKQYELCFYSGYRMKVAYGCGPDKLNLSVDKIVPHLGYIKGNVVFCCNRINTMKSDVTLDEMREWMPNWYRKVINMWEKIDFPYLQEHLQELESEGDF